MNYKYKSKKEVLHALSVAIGNNIKFDSIEKVGNYLSELLRDEDDDYVYMNIALNMIDFENPYLLNWFQIQLKSINNWSDKNSEVILMFADGLNLDKNYEHQFPRIIIENKFKK